MHGCKMIRGGRGFRALALLSTALVWSVLGCEREPAPSGGQPEAATRAAGAEVAAPGETYVIGFSQCTLTEPWRVEFNRRLKEHAEQKYAGVVELIMLDADDQTEQQVAQMRTFIQRDVDAILVSPKEAAGLTDVVRGATEAGIPVVVLDRDVHWDGYACFVGADNRLIGRAAGKVAVDLLGGPENARGVIYEICGGLASTPAQERRDGFHDIVDAIPEIEVIGGLDCDWKLSKAQDTFKTAPLDRIDLVYAHNDPMAYGAHQAAAELGRAEEIDFIGIDALPNEGQQWVRRGALTATLLYPTPGEAGLDMAIQILRGQEVPRRVTLPTRVFTQDNVDEGGAPVALDVELEAD